MKITLYNLFLSFLFVWIVLSCEEEAEWEINDFGAFLVVDCIITNEMKFQEINVTREVDDLNDKPVGVSRVQCKVSDGTDTFSFIEDTAVTGRYVSTVPFMASTGKTYRMTITYGNLKDTAYSWMAAVTPLESVDIEVYDDNLYRYIYSQSERPSMSEVFYDWSADSVYCRYYGSCQASEVFYTLDNIDVGKIYAPERQIIPFPLRTRIIRRKYSINEDHQKFLRSLLLETDWRGGLFDAEQGNVLTNFHYGVRGWFGVCMVLADTTYFE
jgi:hypothetical protein